MAVYILTDNEDARILNLVTKALEGETVEVSSTNDDDLTEAEWRKIDAASSIKVKTYLGRIVGNTQKLEKDVKSLVDQFAPISQYFANLLVEQEEQRREEVRNRRLAEDREKAKAVRGAGI